MDLLGDQEDLSPISRNIGNQEEKVAPKEENKTPQIKETFLKVSGTNSESPIHRCPLYLW
jgi:hypothetical protein